MPSTATLVSQDEIAAARRVIAGRLHCTPTMRSTYFSRLLGVSLFFKMELFQKTGSFKPRGVLNKLHHLRDDEKRRGVISLSAGNHAQALAWAAAESGIPSTIIMPATASRTKVDATKGYGGEVVQTEGDLLETCLTIQRERGLTLVHPFDDPVVIAGQGTVGLELLEDVPDVDTVVVAVGGGGLIAGVATAVKAADAETRVVGVEPEGAAAMSLSLERGTPMRLDRLDTIADGLAAPFAGKHPFEHVKAFVDEMVIVTDREIVAAMAPVLERCKVVIEPAAAAAVAALMSGKVSFRADEKVVCVLCGGNVDREKLKSYL